MKASGLTGVLKEGRLTQLQLPRLAVQQVTQPRANCSGLKYTWARRISPLITHADWCSAGSMHNLSGPPLVPGRSRRRCPPPPI